jgi:tRNA(Ile)-lysidine synthase
MGQSLTRQVQDGIQKQGLLRAGERVGVAVSGGADSVALLLLLLELRAKLGVVLSVAHFNHKLRGKVSDADARFVEKLALKHGLAFHGGHADVAARSKRDKSNLEDTARRSRYEFFAGLVKAEHLDKIVVGHTMDDQAETVLAHILRGTGLAGLGGIHPVVGHVVRPLLTVRRADLRAYLRSKKQTWREDASNRDVTKMRARIRKKLMPILEKQFQPAVVEHLTTLAELAREDEAFLEALVEERARTYVEKDAHSATVRACDLLHFRAYRTREEKANAETQRKLRSAKEENLAVSGRMVRRIVKEVKPRAGQLGAEHVRAVLELAERGENGKRLELPGGLLVRREHDSLIFRATEDKKPVQRRQGCEFAHAIKLDGKANDIRVPELGCVFRLKVIDWPAKRGETTKSELVLDRDALRSPVVLRNWRPGDRFQPLGHRNAHKLKRLLSRKHIDLSDREGWPVLTSGEVLVWVRGFPVAAKFAAGEKTRTGIVIEETVS